MVTSWKGLLGRSPSRLGTYVTAACLAAPYAIRNAQRANKTPATPNC